MRHDEAMETGTATGVFDPFTRGPFPAGVRTIEIPDEARHRLFPCEIWYPAAEQYDGQDRSAATQDCFRVALCASPRRQTAVRDADGRPGSYPLAVFSHGTARWNRRMATYLCTHLCTHGYIVAALDHSEIVAPELARAQNETVEQRRMRVEGWIASRVPDIRVLLDHLLTQGVGDPAITVEPAQVGIIGYSFGGWTALEASQLDLRIRAVVALAPAGISRPKPGMIPVQATFQRTGGVSTLYLAAGDDTMISLEGIKELYARTPGTKRMAILRRADHTHFLDGAEEEHEAVRSMPFSGELAWIPQQMRRFDELCPAEEAHSVVRALTLAHLDMALKGNERAREFLDGDLAAELERHGVDAVLG